MSRRLKPAAGPGKRQLVKEDTPARKQRLLEEIAKVGILEVAAIRAGIQRMQHYRWMADPEYAEAYAAAQRESDAKLEAEVRRRGEEGYKRAVWHMGKKVGEETVYSDNLLMFYVKRRMPEYRDVNSTNVSMTANVQTNVRVDLTKLTDEQLTQLEELAKTAITPPALPAVDIEEAS
jgi:hypothetical protein